MIYLYIYLLGSLVVWGRLKYEAYYLYGEKKPNWENIGSRFLYSLVSWLVFVILGVIFIRDNVKITPPKWL